MSFRCSNLALFCVFCSTFRVKNVGGGRGEWSFSERKHLKFLKALPFVFIWDRLCMTRISLKSADPHLLALPGFLRQWLLNTLGDIRLAKWHRRISFSNFKANILPHSDNFSPPAYCNLIYRMLRIMLCFPKDVNK